MVNFGIGLFFCLLVLVIFGTMFFRVYFVEWTLNSVVSHLGTVEHLCSAIRSNYLVMMYVELCRFRREGHIK